MLPRIKAFFKNSLTLFWARFQYVVGIIGAGLIATFSNYDFSQLASMDAKDAFKLLMWAVVAGVVTEACRRRTL